MASFDYWDYHRWGTGTATTSASSSSAYGRIFDTSDCTSAGGYTQWRTVTRKILVYAPENWTEEQNMKFVELVNIKTKTGWKVTLVIKGGHITITDPNVERRTMSEFVPLLKYEAIREDIILINDFFDSNPC